MNQGPVEAIDLTEAGPEQRDVEFYRSPARGQLAFAQPVSRRRGGPDVAVSEGTPRFLGEFIFCR